MKSVLASTVCLTRLSVPLLSTSSLLDDFKNLGKLIPLNGAVSVCICKADKIVDGAFLGFLPKLPENFGELICIE